MTLYLDASVLVPLFIRESTTARLKARLAQQKVMISGFGAAEFSAAIARLTRIGQLSILEQASAFAAFDQWVISFPALVDETPADMQAAKLIVRQPFNLRTPDALHIALAMRTGAVLMTLDQRMATAASALGVEVEA